MRTKMVLVVPGVVLADTPLDIDGGDFEDLINVDVCLLTEGGPNTIGVTAQTILAKGETNPASGECALIDKDSIVFGDATDASTFLFIVGITEDSVLKLD